MAERVTRGQRKDFPEKMFAGGAPVGEQSGRKMSEGPQFLPWFGHEANSGRVAASVSSRSSSLPLWSLAWLR